MPKYKFIKISLMSVLLLVSLALTSTSAQAQTYHTSSKKAISLYKKAKDFYQKRKYDKSLKFIDKALDSDYKFVEALNLKADIGIKTCNDDMAIEFYEKSLAADYLVYPKNAIILSNLYNKHNNYSASVAVLKWYCSLKTQKEENIRNALIMLKNAEFRDSAVRNPVKFNPKNLGRNVNSDGDEYINQILPDGSRIYFTRRLNEKDSEGYRIEGVYTSSIVNSEFMPSMSLNLNWNNNKRMGAVNISADQNKMFFVGFDWLDSQGRGDIYMSVFDGSNWGKPVNLGKVVNTSTYESQPCISPNGKELFFTRYSRTYESTDIYVTTLFDGKWSNPQAILNVNSKGNEMSPFIHPDGKTLYFVSDGLPGMGGYDVFMCKRNNKGEWGQPVNLGYPLNTPGDEISFAVSTDGKTGYISSIREGGFGGFDIYSFELDAADYPEFVDYQYFVLNNICFELNSAVLDSTSFVQIDTIANYLKENDKVNIEISGYTDNTGNPDYNFKLSKQRAISVKTALVKRGIKDTRINAVGFGENRPLVPNDSEEHKAMNRRVELRILQ